MMGFSERQQKIYGQIEKLAISSDCTKEEREYLAKFLYEYSSYRDFHQAENQLETTLQAIQVRNPEIGPTKLTPKVKALYDELFVAYGQARIGPDDDVSEREVAAMQSYQDIGRQELAKSGIVDEPIVDEKMLSEHMTLSIRDYHNGMLLLGVAIAVYGLTFYILHTYFPWIGQSLGLSNIYGAGIITLAVVLVWTTITGSFKHIDKEEAKAARQDVLAAAKESLKKKE